MSKTRCAGAPANKARFKGVENFLKRVAYNLGNSPSQTDVKIISCIPIDVSDLQQKIICLEKQLEETKCFQMTNIQQNPIINTALCDCPNVLNCGVSCNMLDINRSTSPCPQCKRSRHHNRRCSKKKSFVSFAESPENEPRCTCHLESPECSCSHAAKIMSEENFNPNLSYGNNCPFTYGESKPRSCRKNLFSKKYKSCKYKKPKAQCVYYAQTRSTPFNTTKQTENILKRPKAMTHTYLAEMVNKQYKPRPLGGNLSEISNLSAPVCRDSVNFNRPNCYESDLCSCFHDGYQNIDKYLNANQNSYLINSKALIAKNGYYDSTYYDVFPVKDKPVYNENCLDMPKRRELRQWTDVKKPTEVIIPKVGTYPMKNTLYVNSLNLPHSTEKNIDRRPKYNERQTIPPVVTIPKLRNRMSNIDRKIKIQESKSCCIDFINLQLHPKIINRIAKADKSLDIIQGPPKSDSECLTTLVTSQDCQTGTSIGADDRTKKDIKTENTLNQIKNLLQSVLQEVKDTAISKFSIDEKVKKDADIQKDVSQMHVAGNVHNNSLQDSKRENVQDNIPGNIQGEKLGSVPGNMTESQHCNMAYSYSGAVPIHTQTPVHVQASRFISSYTYSPYNNSPCVPSCSKQLNSNSYCYSSPPTFKYFMNYPVYMHSPGRQVCTNCYRHNAHLKPPFNKQVATNTEHLNEEHNNETHKLIKELYKSMAVNIDNNNKNSSTKAELAEKNITDAKEVEISKKVQRSPSVKEFRKAKNVVQAVSELFRKKEMLVSSDSPNTTAMESMQESVGVILCTSSDVKTKFGINERNNVSKCYTPKENMVENGTSTQNSATSVSESTTESEVTLVPPESKKFQRPPREKKEILGLFSKMIKSVFKQKYKRNYEKKESSVETLDTEEETSDSDDYQTVYSQRLQTPIKYTPKANYTKRRTHSKITYNKQAHQTDRNQTNTIRKSPYMEQEYRRYWNEKLMFHDRYRQSSDLPTNSYDYSSEFKPPFFEKYQARAAIIPPKYVTVRPINAKKVIPTKQQKIIEETEPKASNKRLAWLKNSFNVKKNIGNR